MKHATVKRMRAGQSCADEVRALLAAGRVREAILRAAKFQDLGDHRDRILSAREAYLRPEFQRAVKKDPDLLIRDGLAALRERWPV